MSLIFFDIDGTLVPGMSSGVYLAERLGRLEEMRAAEQAYERGEIENDDVCRVDAAAFCGHCVDEVVSWLDGMPLIDGIAETVRACRELGYEPFLASLAWTVVGDYLVERFGFSGCCGPVLSVTSGRYDGGIVSHMRESGKRDYALAVARSRGVSPAQCVAVGDSRSDLPLFASVGTSIALNASPDARAAAAHEVDTADLRDIMPFVPDPRTRGLQY